MTLSHHASGLSIDMCEGMVTVITVETPVLLAEYVNDLKNLIENDEGEFAIFDEEKEIKFSKEVELIVDPWAIDYNSRKIKGKLLQLVTDVLTEQEGEEFLTVRSKLYGLMESLSEHLPYSLTYNTDIDASALCKFVEFRIEERDNTIVERMAEYIKLVGSLCQVRVIFFVNLKSYISDDELRLLYKEAEYAKVSLILFEPTQKSFFSEEKGCVIDKDRCIIEL